MPIWHTPTTPEIGDHGGWCEYDACVVDVDLDSELVTLEIETDDGPEFETARFAIH